ncbi:hypothetical protein Abol_156_001 [Acetobacter orleanensis JCM 7639]|nr:hypothetical protein Abol_156_001 [Acetobacter orleanensis JCM 7639]
MHRLTALDTNDHTRQTVSFRLEHPLFLFAQGNAGGELLTQTVKALADLAYLF